MSETPFDKARQLNLELQRSGYSGIKLMNVEDEEILGVLVLEKVNEVVDEMELTIQNIEDFEEAREIADDTYIIELAFEIARECLIDEELVKD